MNEFFSLFILLFLIQQAATKDDLNEESVQGNVVLPGWKEVSGWMNDISKETPAFPDGFVKKGAGRGRAGKPRRRKKKKAPKESNSFGADQALGTANAAIDGLQKTSDMIENGPISSSGIVDVANTVLNIAETVADVLPIPYVGAAVRLVSGLFGFFTGGSKKEEKSAEEKRIEEMEGKMNEGFNEVNDRIEEVREGVEEVAGKVDQVQDKLDETSRKVDQANKGINKIGATQAVHTKMIEQLRSALGEGFKSVNNRVTTEIVQLRADIHDAIFDNAVIFPSTNLANAVQNLMRNFNGETAQRMSKECQDFVPEKVFTAISKYAIKANGYFMSQFDAGSYTFETFTNLKERFKQILHNAITAQILCDSLDKTSLTDGGDRRQAPDGQAISTQMTQLANEFNRIIQDINEKKEFIISEQWRYIPNLINDLLMKFPWEDFHTEEEREDAVYDIQGRLIDFYGYKCDYTVIAGQIDNVFVDNGISISPYDESMDKKETDTYFYRNQANNFGILVVRRNEAATEATNLYNLDHFPEGKERWLDVLNMHGKRGRRSNPTISFTILGEIMYTEETGMNVLCNTPKGNTRYICQLQREMNFTA